MKIKFNLVDNLPVNKQLKFLVRSVFEEDMLYINIILKFS